MNASEASAYTLQILTLGSTFATAMAVIIATVIQKLDAAKTARTAAEAAKKAEEVKQQLVTAALELKASNSKGAKEVTDKLTVIHDLVNSSMMEQKRLTMLALSHVAELTKDPKDIAIAQEASRIFESHRKRQEEIDRANANA
jgi:uncharacterized protein related to proFAR isomerase